MGYYAAPIEAVAFAASFLRAPSAGHPFTIFDPCAGEGLAIGKLADCIGCDDSNVYAIELDEYRTERLVVNLTGSNVVAPAAFGGVYATPCSFSLGYVNPPFDSSYDGGRVEAAFLRQTTEWLMPGGILMLVCPENQATDDWQTKSYLQEWYDDVTYVPFPAECRPYKEVVVFGVKRKEKSERHEWRWAPPLTTPDNAYYIPVGRGPRKFVKVAPTESELADMLANSPLRARLTKAPEIVAPSPPLALGIGHVALLLASGHLDGIVQPEGCRPHVVRGTSKKVEYISAFSEEENADGSTTTKTTKSERIDLVVRTVSADGVIRTFAAEPPDVINTIDNNTTNGSGKPTNGKPKANGKMEGCSHDDDE